MSEPVFRATDVSFAYVRAGEPVPVLGGLDVTVAPGERVAVTGPSGSGKSTILAIAAGLLQPDAGTVTVAGVDITRASESQRAAVRLRHVGQIYQDFQLLPRLTAVENVALPARLRGTAKRAALDEASEMLGAVGLAHRLHHRPGELSGGEQQRVGIARALIGRPALLLADEPTGALDEEIRDEILALLLDPPTPTALVLVTHDDDVAARMDRRLRLRTGTLEELQGS